MESIISFLAVLTGLLVRLAIPIAVTVVAVYFLRKLDINWKTEAQLVPVPVQKLECWKVNGCSPAQKKNCVAASSPLPCWQCFRQSNGYLQEKCISCGVFLDAPIPAVKN